jgi:N-acetylneuraminic acid mutarotase
VLSVAAVAALAAAGFVAARALDVRDLLGIRSAAPVPIDACRSAQDVVLPFGFESASGRWHPLPPSPVAQDEPRAAAVGRVVYIAGGLEQKRPGGPLTSIDTFVAYDTKSRTYERLPRLPVRVDHPAVVSVADSLYLVGGYHDGIPLDSLYRYAPDTGRWTKLAPMPTARGFLAAAAIGNRVYAIGGVAERTTYDSDIQVQPSAALEIYDIASDTWSGGRDLPTPTQHAGAASADGKLYVVGGRRPGDLSVDIAQRYDPATDDWHELPPLPLGSGGLQAVSDGRRVIAIGGGDDDEYWVTPATWAYDPGVNRWQRLADLRVARHGHAAAAVGATAYTFGGAPCPGFGVTASGEALELGDRR